MSQDILMVSYPYSIEDARWWVNSCCEKQKENPRESYEFVINIKPSKKAVGGVGLSKVNLDQGTAELGYWISEENWRKGYVSEAVVKLINFAFDELKLRRLVIPVFVENEGSNALAKKLCFKFEGRLRKNCKAKSTGEIHDENVYGLLKEEWDLK